MRRSDQLGTLMCECPFQVIYARGNSWLINNSGLIFSDNVTFMLSSPRFYQLKMKEESILLKISVLNFYQSQLESKNYSSSVLLLRVVCCSDPKINICCISKIVGNRGCNDLQLHPPLWNQ